MSDSEDEFRDRKKNDLIREIISLRAEVEHRTQGTRIVAWSATVKTLGVFFFSAVMVVAVAWMLTKWAGTVTVLSADVNAQISADAAVTFPQLEQLERKYLLVVIVILAVAASGVSYGLAQKKLRELAIKELYPYKQRYEKEQDPNRSSSKLSKDERQTPMIVRGLKYGIADI